MNREISFH